MAEKLSHGKMKPSTALGRNGGMAVGYPGQIALMRENCDV
jgi:hypothetical protein